MIKTKGAAIPKMKKIADLSACGTYRVRKITGPERTRLSELGLVEGAAITLLPMSRPSSALVRVGGSCLALARGLEEHVWVD